MGFFATEAPDPTYSGSGGKIREIWGGFFRRCGAFSIDLLVLFLFSVLLFYLLLIGYRVGLAANQEVLSLDQMEVFFRLFGLACLFFLASYFVLLHRMGGQTVGKWIMGLRVVGTQGSPITSWQSVMRLVGYLLSGFFGLGFLWILWSREKRGWHDWLADTWVVRD